MSVVTLTLSQLSKKYASPAPGAPGRHALRPVDLSASGGEIVAVVGPNGSGKSTLLKIVAGLLRPSGGNVTLIVGGTALDTAGARGSVGYVSPDIALYPELSGRENLRFFARARGSRRAEETVDSALDSVGLSGRGDDLLQVYSSGMRQRLKIALATLFSPPVLLFDEPGLALDSQGAGVVEAAVRAAADRGALVLLGTNDSREASLAYRHVRLAAGS